MANGYLHKIDSLEEINSKKGFAEYSKTKLLWGNSVFDIDTEFSILRFHY